MSDVDYVEILQRERPERELAAQQGTRMKAKRSAKQKAAAMRNLRKAQRARNVLRGGTRKGTRSKAKARRFMKAVGKMNRRHTALKNLRKAHAVLRAKRSRRARRGSAKTKHLTTRAAARSTHASEASAMKKGKKKARRSAKQKAAALKNLRKARRSAAIARAGGVAGVAKKNKRRKGTKRAKTKSIRKAARTAHALPTPRRAKRRSGKRRFTAKARAAALRNLGKARSARRRAKRAGRRHPVRAYSYHRRPKRVNVKAHRSYESRGKRRQSRKQRAASLRNLRKARMARSGGRRRSSPRGYARAMENALSGVEIFIGGVVGLSWFMMTDFVDRLIATHALTDKASKDAAGHELYADTPPTTGDYANLFNATAICAPMNVWRWLAGLGMTAVPPVIGIFVGNDVARASLQMAGFGAGMRIFGKGLIDLVSYVSMWSPLGQQLYDGEMRAQVLASGDTVTLASLPSTGLGADPTGTGYPSEPREVAVAAPSTGDRGVSPPPPPAPPTPSLPAPVTSPSLAGAPGLQGVPSRFNPSRPYQWGEDRSAA